MTGPEAAGPGPGGQSAEHPQQQAGECGADLHVGQTRQPGARAAQLQPDRLHQTDAGAAALQRVLAEVETDRGGELVAKFMNIK